MQAQPAEATPTTAPEWIVTRDKDPMFDTPAVVAILSGESLQGTHVSGQSLRVQCVDGRLGAAVQWKTPTAQALTAERSPEIEVLIRWGTDTPVWERWRRAGHEPVSESGNPSEFIERLTDHRALAVRTYPSQDRPVTIAFDLRDATPVATEIMTACEAFAEEMGQLGGIRTIETARRDAEAERKLMEEALRKAAEGLVRDALARYDQQLVRKRLAPSNADRMEYIAQIRDKIERNWLRPPGSPLGLKCVVRVSQIPGGEVVQAEISTSSGNIAFDRSVEEAVLRSSPLPLPKLPSLFDRHIVITFEP